MTAKFRHEGNTIDFERGTAVVEGEAVDLLFEMVGIALQPIAANVLGALAIARIDMRPKGKGRDEQICLAKSPVEHPAAVKSLNRFRGFFGQQVGSGESRG